MTDVLTIELPDPVSREVRRQAEARGITAEVLLAELAMLQAGDEASVRAYFKSRAARADHSRFEKVFSPDRPGGEPPRAGDEIE